MTISELIEKLNSFDNKDIDVEVLTTVDFGSINYETITEVYMHIDPYSDNKCLILK